MGVLGLLDTTCSGTSERLDEITARATERLAEKAFIEPSTDGLSLEHLWLSNSMIGKGGESVRQG